MSESTKEDLFDRLFKRADSMFARADKMFDNSFFYKVKTTSSPQGAGNVGIPTTEFTEEDPNPKREYKVVAVYRLSNSQGMNLEVELNKLGEEGWDLIHYDGGEAIFSRIAE